MTQESSYIVVVDDDPNVASFLGKICGSRVCTFRSAETVLRAASRLQPRAVFLDVFLDGSLLGTEIIRQLKAHWPHVPLLAMSASKKPELQARALDCGADDFVDKPLVPVIVLARLQRRSANLRHQAADARLVFGGVALNQVTGELQTDEGATTLDARSAALLVCLLEARGDAVPAETLLAAAWGAVKVSRAALERKVSELRGRLKDVGAPLTVKSRYGSGYCLQSKDGEVVARDFGDPSEETPKRRVMLVDDSDLNLAVAEAIFSDLDVEVSTAGSAEDALDQLRHRPCAIVVWDEELPGLAGSEAAAILNAERPEITMFGLHGSPAPELSQRCLDAGMLAVFPKPLSPTAAQQMLSMTSAQVVSTALAGDLAASFADLDGFDRAVLLELSRVGGDGFVERLLTTFITTSDQVIAQIRASLELPPPERIKQRHLWHRLAHKLKGLCLSIGANDAARHWQSVEEQADSLEVASLLPLLRQAIDSYERLRRVADRHAA